MRVFHNCIVILFLLLASELHAQKTKGGVALNASVGLSSMGILGSLNFSIRNSFDVESRATPAYCGSIDFGMENKLSLGIGGGYQAVHQTIRNYQYADSIGISKTTNFSYSISRMNIGARILFHYGNGSIDAYSGIKPGINIYNVRVDQNIVFPGWLRSSGTVFAFQVIPIGIRAYFSDNFGINFEAGIGAPSFISAGLCVGFQSPNRPLVQPE